MKQTIAIGLFSGGLDSISACRVIMAQSIKVIALKFVTPFFDDGLLRREEEYHAEVQDKFGLDVRVVDLSEGYIDLLRAPKHGYGKHFNPCIDCKIFMLSRARELMEEYDAAFLFTGEVIGQRPMSQRRDTLRIIERDSGCEDILLRPLCAKLLKETLPERKGLVDREQLFDFSGRGRRRQMELAEQFGITEYPNPAGGCILTDPNLGERIEKFYLDQLQIKTNEFLANDIRLLLVGRQFRLPGGDWFILGRNQEENEKILALADKGDAIISMSERPGPTGLLRRVGKSTQASDVQSSETVQQAAGLVIRFGRKVNGQVEPSEVRVSINDEETAFFAAPLKDDQFVEWKL